MTFFSLTNCQEKKIINQTNEKILENEMETSEVKKILIKQIKSGPGSEYWGENEYYTKQDLDALISIEDTILNNNGYKIPEQGIFNEKINNIFGRIIDNKSENSYLKVDKHDKCNKVIDYQPVYTGIDYIYVDKNHRFITTFYSLPSILDYQKIYPDVSKYEEKPFNITYADGTKQEISRWKDLKNLPKERRFNQQLLISRNKYLFNDDKSQFAWLINNDEDFMQSLVTTFGYTEDKKLLKWAFEKQGFKYQKYPPDEILENYGNFLWTKQCNGEIKLHPNTLNLIKELVKPSSKYGNEEYILYLAEYINYLVNNEKETGLNFQQKAKIAAYLLAFGEQYKYNKEYGYNQMFLGKFIFYQDPDKKYKKEFEKNNYYNLPNLKKWYQQAEQEKDMFENDQTLADDPQPMDYLYRATYMKGPYSK
ncbi:hypothetical protein C4S77_11875 [Apibacter adventoris]|uniref:Uncharacterized protein n=2 Tax=Apibacter adventoris TaxID=1679466 RepID=A0A2S8A7S0_9FLAO|nr:hypothetical protein C4S77_11875 [Apibacter adventoris]